MFTRIPTVAEVSSGYPFRAKITDKSDGCVHVVQMKQVDPITGIRWNDLTLTDLPGRPPSRWLEPGDVVFAARGITNYAVVADCPPKNTVLSPHFFQIRVRERAEVLPEFLAWQLNQAPAQQYFKKAAEGSSVVVIKKAQLESMEIACPPLAEQKKIIQAVRCWREQQEIIQALSDNHQKLMAGIADHVFNKTIG